MATAPSIIHTEIDHVSVMACADDIKILDHNNTHRVIKIGRLYVYVDSDGVTALLEQLLAEPEAVGRPELAAPLTSAAAAHTDCIRRAV